jgi:hypothetical protein
MIAWLPVDATARRPGPPAEGAVLQIWLKDVRGSGYRASLAMAGADMSVLSADAAMMAIRAAAQASHECDLSYRKIGVGTARAVAAAAQAAALVKLSVYRAGLKDEAVAAMMLQLGRSATLQHLDLSYNVIGDAGAAAVAAALRQNDALLSLMMHQNVVGDSGALALAEAMRDNTVLQTLSLTHNKIGAAGAQAILSTMEDDNFTLTSINLGQNNHAGDVSHAAARTRCWCCSRSQRRVNATGIRRSQLPLCCGGGGGASLPRARRASSSERGSWQRHEPMAHPVTTERVLWRPKLRRCLRCRRRQSPSPSCRRRYNRVRLWMRRPGASCARGWGE